MASNIIAVLVSSCNVMYNQYLQSTMLYLIIMQAKNILQSAGSGPNWHSYSGTHCTYGMWRQHYHGMHSAAEKEIGLSTVHEQ